MVSTPKIGTMRFVGFGLLMALASLSLAQRGPTVVMPASETLPGITFASHPKAVFVPLVDLGEELSIEIDWDTKRKQFVLDDLVFGRKDIAELFDGTPLVNVFALERTGIAVERDVDSGEITITSGTHFGIVEVGSQWVEVNLQAQRLRAYQGDYLVMETKVSTGKKGNSTITGEFKTGPEKSEYRTSSLYEDAPMPYSVQVHGNYFIHGSSSVPNYPASHGCVRMPLTGRNAAKYFFRWVNLGVPVSLRYGWSARVTALQTENR